MLLIKYAGSKEFESKSAEDFADMFDIPIGKIMKSPEFIINPDRKAKAKPGQSKEISSPAGTGFMANMFVKMEGRTVEIRYAQTINQVEKGDKIVDEYYPRKLKYLGENMLVEARDIELSIYMYLYPLCKQSPFRGQIKEKFHWSFKDLEAESTEEMAATNEVLKALNAINKYTGESLRVIARSFNLVGLDDSEDVIIQAQLVKIATAPAEKNSAKSPAQIFNEKIGSNVHIFRGLSLTAIDKGLFVVQTVGGGEYWAWGAGEKKGHRIVDINNSGLSKQDVLLIHIEENAAEFYPIIHNSSKTMAANNKAKSFLDKQAPIDLNSMFNQQPTSESDFGGSTDDTGEDLVLNDGNSHIQMGGNIHLNQNGSVTVEPAPSIDLSKSPEIPEPVQPVVQQAPPAEAPAWMQDRPSTGRKPGAKNK